MARTEMSTEEMLRLVIAEVDEARDILQLAEQLGPLLPIKSFDDLARGGDQGRMVFRDTPFDVDTLRPYIPALAFPITDPRALIERLGYLVRLLPEHFGVDTSSPDGMRRQMRHAGLVAPGFGAVARRGLMAIAREAGAEPQSIPTLRQRSDQ